MGLAVGQIVWARHNNDGVYWPGKITFVSNNTADTWSPSYSSELLCTSVNADSNSPQQQCVYLVQFFGYQQTSWIVDVLPYREYRDGMSNYSFVHHGLHSSVKQCFLNALNEADYASNNEICNTSTNVSMSATTDNMTSFTMVVPQNQQQLTLANEGKTDNDFLCIPNLTLASSSTVYSNSSSQVSDSSYYSIQTPNPFYQHPSSSSDSDRPLTNSATDFHHAWESQLNSFIEPITPPLPPSSNDEYSFLQLTSSETFPNSSSIIIVTTKSYSTSPLISYLFSCLSSFPQRSLLCLDDPMHLHQHQQQHVITPNRLYLICLDRFDTMVEQALNTSILHNLYVHINYVFLILNAPSYRLITHFYSTVMDKRSILVLHFHSNIDPNTSIDNSLLLCSGNQSSFEFVRSSFLQYLCSQVKYIESTSDEQLHSAYFVSSVLQSTDVLNHFANEQMQNTLRRTFESDFLTSNQSIINELFPQSHTDRYSNQITVGLRQIIGNLADETLQHQSKQRILMDDLMRSGAIKTKKAPPLCEYYMRTMVDR